MLRPQPGAAIVCILCEDMKDWLFPMARNYEHHYLHGGECQEDDTQCKEELAKASLTKGCTVIGVCKENLTGPQVMPTDIQSMLHVQVNTQDLYTSAV